jgi:hypothetical protein
MTRCYDPRRMSRAARGTRSLGRAIRAIAWMAVLVVLSISGAGLVSAAFHAPGSDARVELTYAGDAALTVRLDAAAARLEAVAAEVEQLAKEAKTALAEVASVDPTLLHESLQRGGQAATTIDVEADALRAELEQLPGTEPDAILRYSNPVLVRRSAIAAAVEAASTLAGQWQVVAARSIEAANLSSLLAVHDETVVAAAAKGRVRAYDQAISTLGDALALIAQVAELRKRLIAGTGNTVLDEWILRNTGYDTALRALYQALVDSHGAVTPEVQAARRGERVAFEQLPPDRRTIIVILSEVTTGGLTEAVIAIEDAGGRIDDALGEAGAAPA